MIYQVHGWGNGCCGYGSNHFSVYKLAREIGGILLQEKDQINSWASQNGCTGAMRKAGVL